MLGSAYVTFVATNIPMIWTVGFVIFQIQRMSRNLTQNEVHVQWSNDYYKVNMGNLPKRFWKIAVNGVMGNEIDRGRRKVRSN